MCSYRKSKQWREFKDGLRRATCLSHASKQHCIRTLHADAHTVSKSVPFAPYPFRKKTKPKQKEKMKKGICFRLYVVCVMSNTTCCAEPLHVTMQYRCKTAGFNLERYSCPTPASSQFSSPFAPSLVFLERNVCSEDYTCTYCLAFCRVRSPFLKPSAPLHHCTTATHNYSILSIKRIDHLLTPPTRYLHFP